MNYIYRNIMMTLVLALVPFMGISAKKKTVQQSDRQYWCSLAYKMAQPVLENMAKGELQKNMQTEFSPSFDNRNKKVLYMECFGRLMAGVAPWLTLPDDATAEGKQRKQLREWALASYKNAVNPQNPDYLCWGIGGQNLVDAAYIAESFLRAYDTLWKPLDEVTKKRYLTEFAKLRHIDPPYTNWLLFSSTIESFMAKAGGDFDEYRVNSACRKVEEWYVGDGWYADGPSFAFDYYSSYVFHLTADTPAEIVRTLRVNGILVGSQRPLTQLLALLAFGSSIIRKGEPWSHTCHQSAEALHIEHLLVAVVEARTELSLHILLQLALSHVFEHWLRHLIGQRAPILAVALLRHFLLGICPHEWDYRQDYHYDCSIYIIHR